MKSTGLPALVVSVVPLTLALVGIAVPLVGSDFAVWQLSLLWLLVVGVFAVTLPRAHLHRSTRVFGWLVALPLLFLLGFEGGWWLIPAVAAQAVVDAWAARADHERTSRSNGLGQT